MRYTLRHVVLVLLTATLASAALARTVGCHGIRVERPEQLEAALREALAQTDRPTLVDVVVTRDPAQMLPGIVPSADFTSKKPAARPARWWNFARCAQ